MTHKCGRLQQILAFLLTGLALVLFQNCSAPHSATEGQTQRRYGGEGADGMHYQRIGLCAGPVSEVVDAVVVANDLSSAQLVRQNCQDLATPQTIPVASLGFAVNESSVFVLGQKIFAISQDGSTFAPSGAAQLPNLLASYMTRPSWKVAGVDYAVGPQPNTVFKNPATIAISGVLVNASSHEVTVNADNVTLDGYDFSLDGGWTLTIGDQRTTSDVKILNSKFKIGSNHQAMINGPGAINLYVGYCTLDGNNTHDNIDNTAIFFFGTGLTVEYSWVLNTPGDFIESGAGTVLIRYNLFNNAGQVANTAADWLQLEDGNFVVAFDYNTFYQTVSASGGTEGMNIHPQTSTQASHIEQIEIANNTIVTLAGANVGSDITVDTGVLTGEALVRDNYADTSGSTAFATAGSSCAIGSCPDGASASAVFFNNLNMVTAAPYSTSP